MKKILFIQLVLMSGLLLQAYSQNDTIIGDLEASDTLVNNFGLFTNDEIFDLSLRFDMTEYMRKKPKETYLDAILTYHINANDSVNRDIRLKSRGEMRNGYCNFPPIRLNFKNAEFEKDDVRDINKIKMVTHCQSGNEGYLFKEYLTYKLFNVLTDTSFRVRLIRVEYIDTNPKKRKQKIINTYAFLIEPAEIMAERLNATVVESTTLSQKNMYPKLMDRLAIFNYMIGNTDWSVPNQHNCKILISKIFSGSPLGIVVPYDFDYSGLVDADYAIPYEPLGLESVRERRYVGMCRDEAAFISAVKEFSEKREEFYKVINDFQLLSAKEKSNMINYLDSFYAGIDEGNSLVSKIQRECTNF